MRKIDVETTPSLLVRIRDHDDRLAWSEFTAVYSPLIYNYCRLRGLQSADAADVTQEVLVRVANGILKFEYDNRQGLFRDWIARVVNNEISRFTTRRVKIPEPNSETMDSGQADDWNELFYQHIMDAALDRCEQRFTTETWNLFKESWIHQRPVQEVAAEEGVAVDKVYVARSRVLKQLRHEVSLLAEDAG